MIWKIRIAYNPANDGKYVYFFFNISGKMDGKKPGSIEYEVLYVYEVNGKIDAEGTCPTPKSGAFDIEQITSKSASFVNKTDAQSIKWRYRPNKTGAWTEILGYYTQEYISELKPGTQYEVQVKKWCDTQNRYSSWSPSKTFTTKTTEASCNAPKLHEMSVSNITPTSARLVIISLQQYVKWSYRKAGYDTWISLGTTSGKQRDLNKLTPATTYEFRTAVICGNTVSSYSPIKKFTTLPATCKAPAKDQIKLVYATTNLATLKVESQQSYFRWAIRKSGTSDWDLDNYSWDNEILLSNLDPGTTYVVHVKVKCNDAWSKWSSPGYAFKTAKESNCRAPFTNELSVGSGPDWAVISVSTDQTKVDFEYREEMGSTIQVPVLANQTTQINDLTPETNYEFRARILCNGNWSSWSFWKAFRTGKEDCKVPSLEDLSVTNLLENEATLRVRSRKSVQWRLRENGLAWRSLTGITIADGDYQQLRLSALDLGVNYEFSVRFYCNGKWTTWSSPYPFQTTECRPIQSDMVTVTHVGENQVTVVIEQSFQSFFAQLLEGASLHDIGFISANTFEINNLNAGTNYSLFSEYKLYQLL